jgi:hypothetical protein
LKPVLLLATEDSAQHIETWKRLVRDNPTQEYFYLPLGLEQCGPRTERASTYIERNLCPLYGKISIALRKIANGQGIPRKLVYKAFLILAILECWCDLGREELELSKAARRATLLRWSKEEAGPRYRRVRWAWIDKLGEYQRIDDQKFK